MSNWNNRFSWFFENWLEYLRNYINWNECFILYFKCCDWTFFSWCNWVWLINTWWSWLNWNKCSTFNNNWFNWSSSNRNELFTINLNYMFWCWCEISLMSFRNNSNRNVCNISNFDCINFTLCGWGYNLCNSMLISW